MQGAERLADIRAVLIKAKRRLAGVRSTEQSVWHFLPPTS